MNKKEARALALQARRQENPTYASKRVVKLIRDSHVLDSMQHIGIYYPIGKEISVLELIKYYPDKSFYLPITRESIDFVLYNGNSMLADGPLHTKEPQGSIVNRDLIECFIIPCVAISTCNQRVGYGKGFYDRYLDGYKGYKIGICYKSAYLDIECEFHDLYLNQVVLSGK